LVLLTVVFGLFGYSCGYEGYEDGRHYIGVYSQDIEYGYIVGFEGIYLDTVMTKSPI